MVRPFNQPKKRIQKIIPPIREAAEEFIERYAKPKNRSWEQTQRIFDVYVFPEWGDRLLHSIERRDINDLLDGIVAKGHHALANKVFATLRAFINWCIEREKITASPIAAMKAPAKEVSRDRVLTDSEIIVAWNVWENMAWPFGDAFKLMLITGQRRSEVASMRWKDIDKKRKVWTLPRENTKSDRLNEVPLSKLALEIIDTVPKSGPLLFSTNSKTPISGFSKAKSYCDTEILNILKKENPKAKLVAWRLHDLRRTLSTNMARLRISEHVVERLINHAIGASKGTAGIYNRHGYTDEKQHAMDTWSQYLDSLINGTDDRVLHLAKLKAK